MYKVTDEKLLISVVKYKIFSVNASLTLHLRSQININKASFCIHPQKYFLLREIYYFTLELLQMNKYIHLYCVQLFIYLWLGIYKSTFKFMDIKEKKTLLLYKLKKNHKKNILKYIIAYVQLVKMKKRERTYHLKEKHGWFYSSWIYRYFKYLWKT